jgi:hypothetical protein
MTHILNPTWEDASRVNAEPSGDGDVVLYDYCHDPAVAGARRYKYFDQARRVIFVNGIWNKSADHRQAALAVSKWAYCPVLGLYNATEDDGVGLADLRESVRLKLFGDVSRKVAFALPHSEGWRLVPDRGGHARAPRQYTAPSADERLAVVTDIIRVNAAVTRMFHLLRCPTFRFAPVIAHSEGNLITRIALEAVQEVDGEAGIAGRQVRSYGSPVSQWPSGIRATQRNYGHHLDFVTWFAGPRGLFGRGGSGWTWPTVTRQHDFLRLLHAESLLVDEYTTRFCGVTLKCDDEHLAYELARMKENGVLVEKVFDQVERGSLRRARDLACYYVEAVPDLTLSRLHEVTPQLVARLKRLLAGAPLGNGRDVRVRDCLAVLNGACP